MVETAASFIAVYLGARGVVRAGAAMFRWFLAVARRVGWLLLMVAMYPGSMLVEVDGDGAVKMVLKSGHDHEGSVQPHGSGEMP